jgi:hypothetical protein
VRLGQAKTALFCSVKHRPGSSLSYHETKSEKHARKPVSIPSSLVKPLAGKQAVGLRRDATLTSCPKIEQTYRLRVWIAERKSAQAREHKR